MSKAGKVLAVVGVASLAAAIAPVAEAQPPIRIGATLSQTGVYAALGQNQLRGYQLCVKQANEKGGALGRKLELMVEAHRTEFPGADLSYHSAAGYGGCQILVEALKRAGSLDGEKMREAILRLDLNTAFGAFKVDRDGIQIAHKALIFHWQDGKKVIVWPEELAPGKPRFPTPPWSQRP